MTQALNQFNQNPVQGQRDLQFNANSVQCRIDTTTAGALVPGTGVKIVQPAAKGGIPLVVECALDSDECFGFINYNIKDKTYDAGEIVGVSLLNGGACMYMTASAAIAQNAVITIVVASDKVKTSVGGSRDCGRAFDAAAADGDLIRVILLPKTTTT